MACRSEGPGGDPLDAGLKAAFGPRSTGGWGGESVLAVLERDCGISSHLLLGDGPDDASELILPEEPGPDGSRRGIGRYLIAGEWRGGASAWSGRGGTRTSAARSPSRPSGPSMPTSLRWSAAWSRRPRSAASCSTPASCPSTRWGLDASRRPFFTMKLVRGQTLASLLNDRAGSVQERRRFLAVFEKVCQTVAYAHSRGVVHRDLKPANVMVGSLRRGPGGRLGPGQGARAGRGGRRAEGRGARAFGGGVDDRHGRRRHAGAALGGRVGPGDAGLHAPRAGAGRGRGPRRALRRLLPGCHPLRGPDRTAAVPGIAERGAPPGRAGPTWRTPLPASGPAGPTASSSGSRSRACRPSAPIVPEMPGSWRGRSRPTSNPPKSGRVGRKPTRRSPGRGHRRNAGRVG